MNHFRVVAIRKVDETIQEVEGVLKNPLGSRIFYNKTKRFCKKQLEKLQQMSVYLDDYLMGNGVSSRFFARLALKFEEGLPFHELAQELKIFRETIKAVLVKNAVA